ncbi:microsomal signal peptidase subunit [Aphelenchoides avenae]|nr:microsomal signal peptidase subunit [Aphelenchus avenae]
MGVLQVYQWYVEKTVFFQADEEPAKKKGDDGGEAVRRWKWSSEMKRYDDKYKLVAEYTQGNRSGNMHVVKSIGNYITDDGEVLLPALKKEVDALRNSLLSKNN